MTRRLLASRLAQLRRAAGLAVPDAAAALEFSESKLRRVESGEVKANTSDVTIMCALYQVDKVETAGLLDMARETRKRAWWSQYRPLFPAYVALESDAVTVRAYAMTVLHGLLQTRAYATAVFTAHAPELREDDLVRQVQLRLHRQDRLNDGLSMWCIIDESVLRRQFGPPGVMAEQLEHIVKMGERPNVTVQVVPFNTSGPPVAAGSFAILHFPDASTVAYSEGVAGDVFCSDPSEVLPLNLRMERLMAHALSVPQSMELLRKIAEQWES
jgi:transcriptional regulator with XRE-family HTH domain